MGFWLALLGFGKSAVGAVAGWLGGLLGWAAKDVRNALLLVLAAALAWTAWSAHRLGGERDRWQATSSKFEAAATKAVDAAWAWKGAHDTLLGNVETAQKVAAEADRRHAADVARQLDQIRERTTHDYQARLDDTRAALRRVLDQLAQAAPAAAADGLRGDGGAAAVPAALTARCQAVGATDCYALLTALPAQLGAAEDNTSQLIALQDYVRGLLAIDFTGQPPTKMPAQ